MCDASSTKVLLFLLANFPSYFVVFYAVRFPSGVPLALTYTWFITTFLKPVNHSSILCEYDLTGPAK